MMLSRSFHLISPTSSLIIPFESRGFGGREVILAGPSPRIGALRLKRNCYLSLLADRQKPGGSMRSTMMRCPLLVSSILERAGKLFGDSDIVFGEGRRVFRAIHDAGSVRTFATARGCLATRRYQARVPGRHPHVESAGASGGLLRCAVHWGGASHPEFPPASG